MLTCHFVSCSDDVKTGADRSSFSQLQILVFTMKTDVVLDLGCLC